MADVSSDQTTTLGNLKAHLKNFCDERDWDQFHEPKELAIGLITEASELLEHFRFQSSEQVKELMANEKTKSLVADELADAFFFVLRFAQLNNIDLTTAYHSKMKRNEQKYPVEKARGSNKKYTDL